jgi:hypothetical protein
MREPIRRDTNQEMVFEHSDENHPAPPSTCGKHAGSSHPVTSLTLQNKMVGNGGCAWEKGGSGVSNGSSAHVSVHGRQIQSTQYTLSKTGFKICALAMIPILNCMLGEYTRLRLLSREIRDSQAARFGPLLMVCPASRLPADEEGESLMSSQSSPRNAQNVISGPSPLLFFASAVAATSLMIAYAQLNNQDRYQHWVFLVALASWPILCTLGSWDLFAGSVWLLPWAVFFGLVASDLLHYCSRDGLHLLRLQT